MQLASKTVTADIGDQLNIQSLQDSSNYEGKQTTGGIGLCIPPFCYGIARAFTALSLCQTLLSAQAQSIEPIFESNRPLAQVASGREAINSVAVAATGDAAQGSGQLSVNAQGDIRISGVQSSRQEALTLGGGNLSSAASAMKAAPTPPATSLPPATSKSPQAARWRSRAPTWWPTAASP